MKVIAFNGSSRPNGNTAILFHHALEPIKARGIETEIVHFGGGDIHGCRACYACMRNKDSRCAFDDDPANALIAKMVEADGILLGSPTDFADPTPET